MSNKTRQDKTRQDKTSQAKPSHSNVIRFSALAISITALSGCGGGGDSSGSPTNGVPTTPIQCTAAQYLDTASSTCISKASQQISGLNLPSLSVGGQAMLNATASSGLAISYLSQTPSICIVNVSQVNALAAGTCVIRAIQAGDIKTLPASQVATTEVAGSVCPPLQYLDTASGTCQPKVSQVITGLSIPALNMHEIFTIKAVASSGLVVSYSSQTPNVCLVNSAQLTALATGICRVVANQSGDRKTLAAVELTASARISPPSGLPTATGITTCGDAINNGLSCNPAASQRQDGEVQAGRKMSYSLLRQNAEDCVKDNATGLVWEQKINDVRSIRHKDWTYTWYSTNTLTNGGNAGASSSAIVACGMLTQCDTESYLKALNASNYCGYSDWRLPTRTELISLVDYSSSSPSISSVFTDSRANRFWSSSAAVNSSSFAWYVSFEDGQSDRNSKSAAYNIRAVRYGN